LVKLHSHHYPGLLGRFRSRRGLQKFMKYSQTSPTLKSNLLNVGKVLLLAKQT